MITKILPIVLLASIFYIGSIYSSRNLGKKLEKRSQTFNDPVIENYLKAFQSILDLSKLKVFVLNEKQVNGLVTPNGNIYITQGFINQYKLGQVSGADLSSVIAHELGLSLRTHKKTSHNFFRSERNLSSCLNYTKQINSIHRLNNWKVLIPNPYFWTLEKG